MRSKRFVVLTLAGALVAGGAGVAVGATAGGEAEQRERQVLGDAAARLGTSPEKLREALRAAEDAQLDRAVRAGELTQEQADRIKERRNATGLVLGGPGGHHGFRGGPGGFGGHGGPLELGASLAKALGITEAQLHERFEDGETVAAIAKAEGRTLAQVRSAVRADARQRLADEVRDGDLTQAQADEALEHLDEHLERIGELGGDRGPRGPGGGFGHRGGHELGASLAKALGITQAQLRERFEDGETVAEIAKTEGKTLAQVRSAVRADARRRLADEVRDGDLTQAQADEALEHLDEHLERIGEIGGDRGGFRGRRGFHGP